MINLKKNTVVWDCFWAANFSTLTRTMSGNPAMYLRLLLDFLLWICLWSQRDFHDVGLGSDRHHRSLPEGLSLSLTSVGDGWNNQKILSCWLKNNNNNNLPSTPHCLRHTTCFEFWRMNGETQSPGGLMPCKPKERVQNRLLPSSWWRLYVHPWPLHAAPKAASMYFFQIATRLEWVFIECLLCPHASTRHCAGYHRSMKTWFSRAYPAGTTCTPAVQSIFSNDSPGAFTPFCPFCKVLLHSELNSAQCLVQS